MRELDVELEEFGVSFTEIFVLDGPGRLPFFITYTPTREENLAGYRRARSTRANVGLTSARFDTDLFAGVEQAHSDYPRQCRDQLWSMSSNSEMSVV